MDNTKTYCFGRYLIDIPVSAQINGQAYEYIFGRLDTLRASDDIAIIKENSEKIINTLKTTNPESGYTYDSTISPNIKSKIIVSVSRPYGRQNFGFDMLREDGNILFSMKERSFQESIFLKEVLPTVKSKVIPNLHARKSDDIPAQPGFCLKDGFIADDGTTPQYENAGMSFKFPQWPGIVITVSASTTTKAGE
ncbi:T6SS immunity protein Tli4 family protein, partial [Burkholderia alba]|uniref:T6SS immunity protein Tli4 family protein n=1 Tax=Burkholderia alba TaxID=2683677 RepID=UPI002B056273